MAGPIPIGSMYGIFTYIYHKKSTNVVKYTSPMDPMGLFVCKKNGTFPEQMMSKRNLQEAEPNECYLVVDAGICKLEGGGAQGGPRIPVVIGVITPDTCYNSGYNL